MTTIDSVPVLEATSHDCLQQDDYIQVIHSHLERAGIVKIRLAFDDDCCRYLEQVILKLKENYGHGLPIDHSATRGWFWDIRPLSKPPKTTYQARSETANDFPWHTDCSYESSPPRYFALQVLQPDFCGGGTLSVLQVERLLAHLSLTSRLALCKPEFRINVPPEFIKAEADRQIIGSILSLDRDVFTLRFRADIFTPLTHAAASALTELKEVLSGLEVEKEILHLRPKDMPRGSILLVDNRRWLHARSEVKDPNRHLRRVRWDSRLFEPASL